MTDTSLDTIYVLICAFMVLLMQSGFTLCEIACSRVHIRNVILKNIVQMCSGVITWWFLGYAFFAGDDDSSNRIFGWSSSLVFDISRNQYEQWLQSFVYCATTTSIVSGAMAERARFVAYALFSAYMSLFVYAMVSHWVWAPKGLFFMDASNTLGVIDLAGDCAVHTLGGVTALIGAWFVGPRSNWRTASSTTPLSRVHLFSLTKFRTTQLTFQTLGTMILVVGWFFFNTGSLIQVSGERATLAARVSVTTLLSGVSGGVSALLAMRIMTGKFLVECTLNGLLAGLVSITSGAAVVPLWAAFLLGFIGGLIYLVSSCAIQHYGIDDPVEAASVHFPCGVWGLLGSGLFWTDSNLRLTYGDSVANFVAERGRGKQFGIQLLAALVVTVWSVATAFFGFAVIKLALRSLSDSNADETSHISKDEKTDALAPYSTNILFHQLVSSSKDHQYPASIHDASPQKVGVVSGDLCLMFIDVEGAAALWETDEDMMESCAILCTNIVRTSLIEHGGFEVCTDDRSTAYFLAFRDASACLRCALDVQSKLMKSPWPKSLYKLPHGSIAVDLQDRVILKGLRVRIGIHAGLSHVHYRGDFPSISSPDSSPLLNRQPFMDHAAPPSPANGRSVAGLKRSLERVYGPHVNIAARICAASSGGQILVSNALIARTQTRGLVLLDDSLSSPIPASRRGLGGLSNSNAVPTDYYTPEIELGISSVPHVVRFMGVHSVDGVSPKIELYEVLPEALSGRQLMYSKTRLMFSGTLLSRMQIDRVLADSPGGSYQGAFSGVHTSDVVPEVVRPPALAPRDPVRSASQFSTSMSSRGSIDSSTSGLDTGPKNV
eukprot:ANDGO_05734.mRNA.1 Ammonium transporter 2